MPDKGFTGFPQGGLGHLRARASVAEAQRCFDKILGVQDALAR